MSISPLLAGKHAVVLGATGIIGSHIARAFASHGAVVTLLGRSAVQARAKLEPQMQAYRGDSSATEGPSAHRFIRLDVADRPSIKDVFGPMAAEVRQKPCLLVCVCMCCLYKIVHAESKSSHHRTEAPQSAQWTSSSTAPE